MKSALANRRPVATIRIRRRSATSLILGLSVAMASMVGSAWAFDQAILDAERSEEVAARALNSPEVSQRLYDEATTGLVHLALPDQLTDSDALDDAVSAMMGSEELTTRLEQRFMSAHRAGLDGASAEAFLDDRPLRTEARAILTEKMPGVALKRPSERRFDMHLPIEGYSVLALLRGPVDWLRSFGLALTAIGVLLSLAFSRDRAETCRGAAPWALGAAVGWLMVASGFGIASRAAMPAPFKAVGHTLTVGLNATSGPATAVAVAGLALLTFGALWPLHERRRGAAYLGTAN